MSTKFRPYAPDQMLLLPQDIREWLPDNHLAHHISDLVDGMDLSVFYAPYAGDGRRNMPYDPSMMVKVLIYAYASEVFSSRAIARRLHEDVAFRLLAAGNFPSHRTVCEFRRRHLSDFKNLFVQVLRVAGEMGVVKFGKISIDGTKVRANASKRKAMSYGGLKKEQERLKKEIAALVNQSLETDGREDERYGESNAGDELPDELSRRERRLAAIEQAKQRLEARQRELDDAKGRKPGQDRNPQGGRPYKRAYGEPEDKAQRNFTDPQSSIMKTSTEGFQQCYNAQLAVEGQSQLIVATQVTANGSDQGQMLPVLEQAKTNVGENPETVLADAGYANERDLQALESAGVDGYVALGRESKQQLAEVRSEPARERMRQKLSTEQGRNQYAERKWLSEAPNGWIKQVLGFRQFSVRGVEKVQGEWDLVCLALNAKRMLGLQMG